MKFHGSVTMDIWCVIVDDACDFERELSGQTLFCAGVIPPKPSEMRWPDCVLYFLVQHLSSDTLNLVHNLVQLITALDCVPYPWLALHTFIESFA